MKTILQKLGMLVAVLCTSLSAYAYDFEIDGIYYSVISPKDLTCEVVSGEINYEGDIIIPSEVTYNNRNLSVIAIGSSAFAHCRSLKSLTISDSVTEIGEWAFCDCSSLTSVTIPNSVNEIKSYTFYGCSSLTSITIADSVNKIGLSAFQNCSSLIDVIIPNSVTEIGEMVFRDCSSLTSVLIPNSVTEIKSYTFYGCSSLTSITIADSVNKIGYRAFQNCNSIESINIPNSVHSIKAGAFINCSSLKHITLSDSLENISAGLFADCVELEELVLPRSIEYLLQRGEVWIEDYINGGSSYKIVDTFRNCNNLTSLSILYSPNSLELTNINVSSKWESWTETIKEFYVNRELSLYIPLPNLEKLELGDSIKTVKIRNIKNLEKLVIIESHALVPPKLQEMTNAQYMNVNVFVPEEALEAYKADPEWGNFWNLQAAGVDGVKIDSKKEVIGRYDMNGRAVSENYQGLVIVRFSDGSTKKYLQQ